MSSILDALKKLEADRTQPQAEAEAEAALPESFDVADAEAALFGKKKSAALPKPILLAAGAIGGVGAIIALSVWLSMYMVGRGPQTNTASVQPPSVSPPAVRQVLPPPAPEIPAPVAVAPAAEAQAPVPENPIPPAPVVAAPAPAPAPPAVESPPPAPAVQKPIVIAAATAAPAPAPVPAPEPVAAPAPAVEAPKPAPMPPAAAPKAASPAPRPAPAAPASTMDDLDLPASPLATPSVAEVAANRDVEAAPLPTNTEELPILRGSDRIRYDLENFRINVVRASEPNNPYAHAVINLHKVFIGERIPATTAKLIDVTQTGVAIEIIGTGERFFVRQ